MPFVTKQWIIIVYFAVTLWIAHTHHVGHHFVPVPFPYSAGSYRHTSSVVNVPIHQERLIIVKKPGNHHHHHAHSHGHNHDHAHGHDHDHHHAHFYNHGSSSHGYSDQESRIPSISEDIRPFLNYYQSQQSNLYPFFQDVGFLLDPRLAQQSVWLDQFPDLF